MKAEISPVQPQKTAAWVFAIAFLVYAAGLVAGALYDLDIAGAVHAPASLFGAVMEAVGWYPAFLPTLLLVLLWATRRGLPKNRLWQLPAFGLVAAAGTGALYFVSGRYLYRRELLVTAGAVWLWLALGLALAALLLAMVLRMAPSTRVKMAFFGIWGTVFMAANQIVTYLLKSVWARSRFDDMAALGSFDAFTPWYQPFGNGGSSFPSGHTANAAGIFMLLVLCDLFPALRRRRRAVCVVCWGYIAAMAAARIIIGRHFLSDTLAASAIMAVLFYSMRRTGPYRSGLRKTLANAEKGTPDAI